MSLVPLDPKSEKKLKDLFVSDAFLLWKDTLEAEYEAKLHQAKVDSAKYLIDPTMAQDAKEKLFEASLLRVALDVIEEHASTEKEHHTLHVEV